MKERKCAMEKDIAKSLQIYKEQLSKGDIRQAYFVLMKYVAELKAEFPSEYKTGNISHGYLDYTYFSFFNDFLRERKLRFGIVLNHEKLQFELWLMGQNVTIQEKYWQILKNSKWNQGINEKPIYSELEVILESNIDFENKDEMTEKIITKSLKEAEDIITFLTEGEMN